LEKYEKGVQWIKELLYDTELIVDKLKVVATKMMNDVAQLKRKGYQVVRDLMNGLMYNKGKFRL
jgi:Zn-dependent M16 (insulinase) family peptidase